MSKIKIERLQSIIREELAALREGTDHDSASKLMSSATKLLNAIESFNEASSEKSKAEIGDSLSSAQKILQRIIASPMQYVDSTGQAAVKKVSLKPVKDESLL
jgi:molybdenum-dependent DNA-binding transcriptional regulator ModE